MNIETLHEQLSAEFGGPAIGALPRFVGDSIRPHKGGGSTSSTTQSIPTELKPLASAYSDKAMDLASSPYQGYSGQQVADLNWVQQAGASAAYNRAMGGSPLMNQGSDTMKNGLASGNAATSLGNLGTNQYAGSNPYLQKNIDSAMGDITRNYNDAVAPGLTTQMVGSGSFGNTGAQAATQNSLNDLTKNLSNTASSMRMQDYTAQQGLAENQLNRNLTAAQDYAGRNDQMKSQYLNLAPTYANQAYTDADQLNKVGQQAQDNVQQNLDAQYQSWSDQQNDPYKKLAAMSGVFGSGLGNTATTKQSGGGGK
ncbi:hypothetical protein [Pseudomonas sp. dw_612]|uniref:hypothetical protein n=1 Tax=Pseudomonas sp. dw_612 TaxID=2720080 RepID=UPI001BD2D56D|nr:hypothetical protein [Pseudomonas sp. dw_612]